MAIKNFIEKLQSLSENQKKIILVTVLAVSFVALGIFQIFMTKYNIKKLGTSLNSVDLSVPKDTEPISGNVQNMFLPNAENFESEALKNDHNSR